jgi:very-short-patch-repair endonuclease
MSPAFQLPPRIDSGLRHAVTAIGEVQNGVVRRDQLTAIGVPRHVVENMLASGRWWERGAIVVAMHNGPLTHAQRLWTAVLNAGQLAALAARTAATEQGLVGWEADCVEILVAKGCAVPGGLSFAVKVHESRRFGPGDLHPGRQLPQVRIERALVDAAAWSRSPRTACGVLAAGVQQRSTTASRLRTELDGAGAVCHRRLLARVLTDIEGGAQAMSEIDFLRFCRRHGLPRPALQVVRRDRQGRRRYLDATFERRDGRLVRVEIDGALHLVVKTYWDDMSRGNDLVIDDETVLRFPSYVIHANEPRAVDQIRRILNLSDSERSMAG